VGRLDGRRERPSRSETQVQRVAVKDKREREGSLTSVVMAAMYFGLMLLCLWVALQSRQDTASRECQRRSNNCEERTLPDSVRSR
jgi:hypothetical protein